MIACRGFVARNRLSRFESLAIAGQLCIVRDRYSRLYLSRSLVTLVSLAIAGRAYIARDRW